MNRFSPNVPVRKLLVIGMLLVLSTTIALAQAVQRVTKPIDNSQRVTLNGNVHPLAQARYDTGAVEASAAADHMLLVLKRSDQQEASLQKLVGDLHNRASANYHHWLTPAEFGQRFGVADADLAAVKGWLQANGFVINKVSSGKTVIDFTGTAGQVSNAFHTEIHSYVRDGVTYHANNKDPEIPAALAPVVRGLASLNDVKPRSLIVKSGRMNFNPKTHRGTPLWNDPVCDPASNPDTACTAYVPTPTDMATQYGATSVLGGGTTGTGVTIGIISASNVDVSNVQNYRTFFGVGDPNNLPQTIVDGNDPGQTPSAAVEAYLDVEASSALAPGAKVDLYVGADTLTTSGLFTAMVRAVNDNLADVLSMSYGECEASLGNAGNEFFYAVWEQAAAQGQSVFVSAGDSGTAGCDSADNPFPAANGLAVSGFASTPFNVAVGGTDFYYSNYSDGYSSDTLQTQLANYWGTTTTNGQAASLITPVPEQPWNDFLGLDVLHLPAGSVSIAAGSGGPSSCAVSTINYGTMSCTNGYAKPTWQVGPGVWPDGARDLPDVSLFAADGVNMSYWPICVEAEDCTTYTTETGSTYVTGVGGTSASSPAWAGIMALVVQTQKGRQGNPNFVFYPLAAQFPEAFNDITVGSNNVVCYAGTPDCAPDGNDSNDSLHLFPAGTGYDMASGLGTVNVAKLIADWNKITFTPTTTTLTFSPTTVTHGEPVMATATVSGGSGTPTGSVALVAGTSTPGQAGQGTIELTNGTGATPVILPGGTYNITGRYSGDPTFEASTSTSASVTVTPEVSHVALGVNYLSPNYEAGYNVTPVNNGDNIAYGYIFVVDASITGDSGQGLATGQVTFTDSGTGTVIGTTNLNQAGLAEFKTYSLTAGSHTIVASYSGDPSFNPALSNSLSFSIGKGTTYLFSEDNSWAVPVYAGSSFSVPFVLGGGNNGIAPTGSVTVTLGTMTQVVPVTATVAQGQPLSIGTATFKGLTPGSYTLNLSYPGDVNYNGSTAYPETINVVTTPAGQMPSTSTITSSTTNAGTNGTFTLTAKVTGNGTIVPTGNVYFYIDGLPVAGFFPQIALASDGTASVTLANINLLTGTNQASVSYLGDANYAASNSLPLAITGNYGDFSITTPNPNLVIKSGSTGSVTLTTASMQGLGGSVSFACAPSSASITCSLSPATIGLPTDGSQASTSITINTQLPPSSKTSQGKATRASATWIGGAGLGLGLLFCWPIRRRRMLSSLVLMSVLAVFVLGMVGCGSNSTQAPPQPAPPPAQAVNAPPGNYTVAVTATDAGVVHTITLNVTVQ